ncbi:MAG TPA: metallopeptidase TldD-related protein [Ktedonobacterales bacterium]|nr:metallopeptidase TldD-related protein [Ktedonobacterales bacterium]
MTIGFSPEILGEALAATDGADAWQVDMLRNEETQVYVIGDQTESRREVTNERARVIIHNLHAPHNPNLSGPMLGNTELTLLSSDTGGTKQLAARLSDAVAMASLTDNPPYELPARSGKGFPAVETMDPTLANTVSAALEETIRRLRNAVAGWSSVRLSSAELMAARTARSMRNSRGLTGFELGTDVFLDFVLIAHEGEREAEFHAELHRRRLSDLNIEGTVDAYATFARHALDATTPATHQGAVVLSGEAVANLFNPPLAAGPLVLHTSGQAAFQGVARLKPGDLVTNEEPRGDRLTFLSDSLRPWGLHSAAFDGEGLPAQSLAVIEDGVFRRPWADARYAAYLGIEPTGQFANITIPAGAWSLDMLRSAAASPIYEIVAFSFMNPDPATGDFVAEIKLGYRHDEYGTTPIKGGALAGNIFAALADVRFSTQTYSDGRYFGPAAMRFGNLTIAGG